MIIISHRGYWCKHQEKNSREAFKRSFSLGFGTETDIRDFDGRLVISHDLANSDCISLDEFFEIYNSFSTRPTLALNIKADGLQNELQRMLIAYNIKNYFIFDMAVPDGLLYLRLGMNTFTRHSEYEPTPAFYDFAHGIWLDEFDGHWLTDDVIVEHLSNEKSICIESPELHNRSNNKEWTLYREMEKKIGKDKLMLCTDLPELAKEFFNA